MRKVRFLGCLAVIAALVTGSRLLDRAVAEDAKAKERIATTHDLMEGIVAPNCGALGKALKAETPNWKEIHLHAVLLNEAGYLLMADGRCPDGEWAKGAKSVQECSKILAEKAKAEDLAGAQEAFKALTTEGCATCHKAHKKPKKE